MAWTQFEMSASIAECSGPFGPGKILTPDEVDENLSGFSSIPVLTVMSHWTEDLSWVKFNPFPSVIYSKHPSASGRHHVPKNVAGEATSYLKFIVDYYDVLPRSVVFLHSHRYAYHQEDLLILLRRLDTGRDWDEEYCNINHAVWGYGEDPSRSYFNSQWSSWLGSHLGVGGSAPPPHPVLERCCAQFIVGRSRILSRPLSFYEEALGRMYDAEPHPSEESRRAGLLMEWVWHMVFGEGPVADDEALEALLGRVDDIEQAVLGERSWCVR